MKDNKKIVIIGGGIAGLAAAFRIQEEVSLRRVPVECVLLEGSDRLGGKIQTERFDDFIIEGGPDSFISQKPAAIDLCKRLGIEDRLIGTNPNQTKTYVYTGRKMRTLPDGLSLLVPTEFFPFFTTPLFSWPGKIRMGMDLFIPKKKDLSDESLASFVRRRLGEEALQKMAEPMLAGIYASDPEKMSLKSTFPMFFHTEQKYRSLILGMLNRKRQIISTPKRAGNPYTLFMTLRTGLAEMVEAVYEKSPNVIFKTGVKVSSVERGEKGGPVWRVVLENGEALCGGSVILAPPAHTTSKLIAGLIPKAAESLNNIVYVSTAAVTLAYRKDKFKHPLNGFGFLSPKSEGTNIMACTWTSTKFPQRAPDNYVLLRCYIGGALREELAEQDKESLEEMTKADLKSIMEIDSEPDFVRVFVNRKANVQYHVGHCDRIAQIEKQLKPFPGIYLAGSAYKGIGIPDCISSGTAAAESALNLLSNVD
tara:strand:- start:1622 stop:3058 length:1437 start_codon:yes stop_codon:yes gene_type:complete